MKAQHLRILMQMGEYYSKYFPEWHLMEKSMNLPIQHCAVVNQYFLGDMNLGGEKVYLNTKCETEFHMESLQIFLGNHFKSPYAGHKNQILPYYLLDMASILPVLFLRVEKNQKVLDMCAAPGGKAFLLMQILQKTGQLVANDNTRKRFNRLKKVVKEYIPNHDSAKSNIILTQWCGSLFAKEEQNTFDKILVDAPCSSDRHVIQKEFQYRGWSIKKMIENSKIQIKLLSSAIDALKHGGQVVYSTCSLSPIENDGVVQSVLEKYNIDRVRLAVEYSSNPIHLFPENTFEFFNTYYGTIVVPSKSCNWGPMYFSKITKL